MADDWTPVSKFTEGQPNQQHTPYTWDWLPMSRDSQGHYHWAVPGAISSVGEVAKGAMEQNYNLMTGQPYNPRPMIEGAALGTPVPAAMRAGEMAIPGMAKNLVKGKIPVPTTKETYQAGQDLLRQAVKSPLEIGGPAVGEWAAKHEQDLMRPAEGRAVHPMRAPSTFQILKDLQNAPPGAKFTPSDFQALRQTLGEIAQDFNSTNSDQLAASRTIKALDEFLANASPKDVLAGPTSSLPATKEQLIAGALAGKKEAQRVSELFKEGNANIAAAKRGNLITGELDRAVTGILGKAEGRTNSANSGKNLDNALRSRVQAAIEKPQIVSGLTDEELNILKEFVKGEHSRNWKRAIAGVLGGGGGFGRLSAGSAGGGVGYLMGGWPGALTGGAISSGGGAILRSSENKAARKSIEQIAEILLKRSPLYEKRAATAPMIPGKIPGKTAALARILALSQIPNQNR